MNKTTKRVFSKLSKEESVELKAEKVELAMDFSDIKKRTLSRLKELNKIHNIFLKIEPKIQQVKKGYDQLKGAASSGQKEVDKYFKDFDKKAKDIGIDTKTTQFYKEYLEVNDWIGQMEDIIDDLKARL